MITILHRGGEGSLGTPKSDYVICARPLKVFPDNIYLLFQFCSLDGHFLKPCLFERLVAKLSQYLCLCPSVQNYISRPAKSVSRANRFNSHFVKGLNDTAKVGL